MFCNDVLFDVAFPLGGAERRAWIVALGELDGRAWSWRAMRWTEQGMRR